MPGPPFRSNERVELCPIEREDIDFLQQHINDPRIWRPIGRSRPMNRTQEESFYEDVVCSDEPINLLIVAEDTRLGIISLTNIDFEHGHAEVGLWLAPEYHGQGYGTAAMELLLEHGFAELGLHRISSRVFGFNTPSQRLMERVGFTQEGCRRDSWYVDGDYHDTYWYGLLASEWLDEGTPR